MNARRTEGRIDLLFFFRVSSIQKTEYCTRILKWRNEEQILEILSVIIIFSLSNNAPIIIRFRSTILYKTKNINFLNIIITTQHF